MLLGQAFTIPKEYETFKERFGIFAIGIGNVNDEVNTFYFDKFGDAIPWDERKRMGAVILPMYQALVAAGDYPPFEYHEYERTGISPTESSKLARHIESETGYSFLFIWNYLTVLESLAKGGAIDYKHYDPQLKDLETITEPHIFKTLTEKIPGLLTAAPRAALDFQKNIIIIAAIAGGGYLLFTANKFIKRR